MNDLNQESNHDDEMERIADAKVEAGYQEYLDWVEEVGKHNEPFFQKLSDKYGKDAFEDLFEDCGFSQKIEVVTEVPMEKPDYRAGEDYPCDVYVDQWSVGIEGDTWEGYLYIPYENVFFKIFYNI